MKILVLLILWIQIFSGLAMGQGVPGFSESELSDAEYREVFSKSTTSQIIDQKTGKETTVSIEFNFSRHRKAKLDDLDAKIERLFKQDPNAKIMLVGSFYDETKKEKTSLVTDATMEFSDSKKQGKFGFWERFDAKYGKYISEDTIKIATVRFAINFGMIQTAMFIGGNSAEFSLISGALLAGSSAAFSAFSNVYSKMLEQHFPDNKIASFKLFHAIPFEIIVYFTLLEVAFTYIPTWAAVHFGHLIEVTSWSFFMDVLETALKVAIAQALMEFAYTILKNRRYASAVRDFEDVNKFKDTMRSARNSFNKLTLTGSAMSVFAMVSGVFGATYQIDALTYSSGIVIFAMGGIGARMMFKATELDEPAWEEAKGRFSKNWEDLKSETNKVSNIGPHIWQLIKNIDQLFKVKTAGLSPMSKMHAEFADGFYNSVSKAHIKNRPATIKCSDVL